MGFPGNKKRLILEFPYGGELGARRIACMDDAYQSMALASLRSSENEGPLLWPSGVRWLREYFCLCAG